MTKADFIDLVIGTVKSKGYMKNAKVPRHSFFISDAEGNKAEFSVKSQSKLVHYNREDAQIMVDTVLEVLTEILRQGGFVEFRGFGTFGLKWRAPRRTKVPGTNKWVRIEGHYVPNFDFGNVLRNAAKVYDAVEKDVLEDRRAKYSEVSAIYNNEDFDDFDDEEGFGVEEVSSTFPEEDEGEE